MSGTGPVEDLSGDGDFFYVEPKSPYVTLQIRDPDTGRSLAADLRPINGDTVTVWVRSESYTGYDHIEGASS